MRIIALLFSISLGCFLITEPRASSVVAQEKAAYTCPMHGDVTSGTRGSCPKCGMSLVAAESTARSEAPLAAPPDPNKVVIPDVSVTDQDGRKLNFYTDLVKGKTVAINFIFTTCTTICPPLTATFRQVQRQIPPANDDIRLVSVSVDPVTDVPARLKAFSAKFDARPGWTFVTGDKPEVDRLLRSLGAYVGDKTEHSPMVLIVNDRAGYWSRSYGLAPPATILKALNEASARTSK